MSFLTNNAIKYTLKHLFKVAGVPNINQDLIEISLDNRNVKIHIESKLIIFNISTKEEINGLLEGTLKMNTILTADNKQSIPVMLNNQDSFSNVVDDVLQINADIISLPFIMLSRYEETIVEERDDFGRFEFKNSIAAKYNFIDFPIIDEYAMILKELLKNYIPKIKLIKHSCKIVPTHDIDEIFRFSGIIKTIKTILGDIYLYKDIKAVIVSIYQLLKTIYNSKYDPYIVSINDLINLSKELNLKSEFYFMGAKPSKYDCGYDLNSNPIQDVLKKISENKMVIGLHGGFNTFTDFKLLDNEKNNIEKKSKNKLIKARQHYLRFDINTTFKVMEKVGLKFDSTLGYAEREGFRCGTCHEYYPFDFSMDKQMKIVERPLIVMDATLIDYRNFTISQAFKKLEFLFSRCNFVGGDFVILWHNNYVKRNVKWYNNLYKRFLINYSNS